MARSAGRRLCLALDAIAAPALLCLTKRFAVLKKLALFFLLAGLVLIAILLAGALRLTSKQPPAESVADVRLDTTAAARRLAQALTFRTVSNEDAGRVDTSAFLALHDHLEAAFPDIHATLEREVISGLSLLYTWPGRDPSQPPILLMSHLDVVPVEAEEAWEQGPFSGTLAGNYVWGRGALDVKSGVTGILEAVEILLADGFEPQQTVYLAFGHDEEVGGRRGAAEIAALLKARGVQFNFVLDEGGAIVRDALPGLEAPLAVIGVAEKGYASLELTVTDAGGHSSQPPPQTAIGVLSAAVARLERHPFPARLDGPTSELFDHVGPEMAWPWRIVFGNRWLFGPLIKSRLSRVPATNAAIRTTTAATMIRGGVKNNVLPTSARAVVNFRLLPGESLQGVSQHVRETVADPRVDVRVLPLSLSEPSPVSSTSSAGYRTLARTIRQVVPEAVVAPYVVIGATDARHYAALSGDVYRFAALDLSPDDRSRIHGPNERIAVDGYARIVAFYYQLLRNMNG